MNNQEIISNCKILLDAYKNGKLGYMKMPEDSKPDFKNNEERLVYFTLPMALNYQRNSYKLWEACIKAYNNNEKIFDIKYGAEASEEELRKILTRYKIALQPNKHIKTWQTIAKTIHNEYGDIFGLLKFSNYDFLKLKQIIQKDLKKGFPYLSGPKIFNYWCYILINYCNIDLLNTQYIEIAPDTHVKQCSIKLGVITEKEAEKITTEQISEKWREILKSSGINPIDMHSPLWFWSRNNFIFKL